MSQVCTVPMFIWCLCWLAAIMARCCFAIAAGGTREDRVSNAQTMTNYYYDLATDFYEFGWCVLLWVPIAGDCGEATRFPLRQPLVSAFVSSDQRMCMRLKAWLTASVSLRLARLPSLQAGCGAHIAYAPRLRQAFSRTLWSQNSKS